MPTHAHDRSIELQELLIRLRASTLSLLEHINRPQVEVEGWWKGLDARLTQVELWRREVEGVPTFPNSRLLPPSSLEVN